MPEAATYVRTGLFIAGAERFTTDVLRVADPGKPGVIVGEAASATSEDVKDAISAASRAFPAWRGLGSQSRAEAMAMAIEGIADERDADAEILSRENGKIRMEAWIDALVFEIRWNLALELRDEVETGRTLPVVPGAIPVTTEVSYQPLGVVTVIVPFNWPIAILAASLPHALLAGNTVIVKVPPTAPLATARVVQRVAAKLPAGVINVISGPDEVMTPLIESPEIAKVSFTGSVGGGKRMLEMSSKSLTRTTLELGGNDAAVFFDDAPLDDVHLDRLFSSIYDTTGQICMNVKRVFVHRSRMAELVAGLSTRLERVSLGYGLDDATTMGPLHSPSQKAFVEELIAEAEESGAEVRRFGELPGGELAGGNFVRPAIIVDPDPTLSVVAQEQFGPVIPVIPFDSEEEAISMANDTWAGLGGSVWTSSEATARRAASSLECGYVWVNDHGVPRLDLRAPFGGMKQSGIGRVQGIDGVRAFQDTRAVAHIDRDALAALGQ